MDPAAHDTLLGLKVIAAQDDVTEKAINKNSGIRKGTKVA